MNQKTNKNKKDLRPVPADEMRQNVLKSGLCNEVIAGVLPEDGEIPESVNRAEVANIQVDGEALGENTLGYTPTDEEFEAYIESCRGAMANQNGDSVESLLCRIHSLIQEKNQLIDLIGKIQNGEVALRGENNQIPSADMSQDIPKEAVQNTQMQGVALQMQGGMQNPPMQNPQMQGEGNAYPARYGGGYRYGGNRRGGYVAEESVPRSMGSTAKQNMKRNFIPKSQVEKMSREEIREMFDVIDRSRKEW